MPVPNFKRNLDGQLYIASFQVVLAGGPTVTVNGRTYTKGNVVSLDHFSLDLPVLISSGWVKLADATGTTAQRPTDTEHGHALPDGFHYLDTSLGKVVVRNGALWLDINTGLAV